MGNKSVTCTENWITSQSDSKKSLWATWNNDEDRREKVHLREVTESFLWAESVQEQEFPFCYYSKQT